MTIVLILNVVFSAAVVLAIVGLLVGGIALDRVSQASFGPGA
jgi:hypothetical protein